MTNSCTIALPWQAAQLSPNKRMHWAPKARITATVRSGTAWLAKNSKPVHLARHGELVYPVAVTLHYRPKQARGRDRGNLTLDQKAMIDGLIDAGIAPDDTPEYIDEMMPILHPPIKGRPGEMWLELAWTATNPEAT